MSSTRSQIVMIHGAFCGPWAFDEFRQPFEAAGYDIVAPALRHHTTGSNLTALGRISLRDYVDDLLREIRSLSQPPILLGHSMGGLLAQLIAARSDIRAAILISPSAPWGILPTTVFEAASPQALLLAGDYWNVALKPEYRIAAAHSLDKLPPAARRAVFDRFVPESGRATFEILHWPFDFWRASYVARQNVSCPILCLTGTEDRINPPSTVRQIAARYEGKALFEELQGRSHWPIAEPGWEDIATRAIEWLDGAANPAPGRTERDRFASFRA